MNYFTINGRAFRSEIRKDPDGESFVIDIEWFYANRWRDNFCDYRPSRAAARRLLNRHIERLAIGPDGKRANWSVTARPREMADAIESARGLARHEIGAGARKIIAEAAKRAGLPVAEFVRRVQGEL